MLKKKGVFILRMLIIITLRDYYAVNTHTDYSKHPDFYTIRRYV